MIQPELELLHFKPAQCRRLPPVLFLHGAYAGAWCWQPFMQALAAAGIESYALSFRGHGGSAGRDKLDSWSVDDYVTDLFQSVERLPARPLLVAHSMGGYIAQRFLSRGGQAAGLALLASVPPYGLTGSACFMAMFHSQLLMQLKTFELGHVQHPEPAMVGNLLFSDDMPWADLSTFAHSAQRESLRALSEMLLPQPWRMWALPTLPALVLGAGSDKIIPVTDVWASASALGVEPVMIEHSGHAMMLDVYRDKVLERLLVWIDSIV